MCRIGFLNRIFNTNKPSSIEFPKVEEVFDVKKGGQTYSSIIKPIEEVKEVVEQQTEQVERLEPREIASHIKAEAKVCKKCGKVIDLLGDQAYHYDKVYEEYYCNPCFDQHECLLCVDCGKIVGKARNKPHLLDAEGRYRCKACRTTNTIVCSCCSKVLSKQDVEYSREYTIQPTITPTSVSYYERFPNLKPKPTKKVVVICKKCAKTGDFQLCDTCGKLLHLNKDKYYKIGDKYYCLVDGEEYSIVKRYRYKPKSLNYLSVLGLKKEEKGTLYFGIELELDSTQEVDREEVAQGINNMIGGDNIYITRDGSLDQEKGFEITSHPMDIWYFIRHRKTIESALDMVIENGYEGDSSALRTGLHLHTSRDFFGDVTQQNHAFIKMNKVLVNSILKDDSLERFSRKTKLELIRYSHPMGGFIMVDNIEEGIEYMGALGKVEDRNVLVNITSKTYEHRWFKSTTSYEVILATMELIYELSYIVKQSSFEEIKNITIKDIIETTCFTTLKEYGKYVGII